MKDILYDESDLQLMNILDRSMIMMLFSTYIYDSIPWYARNRKKKYKKAIESFVEKQKEILKGGVEVKPESTTKDSGTQPEDKISVNFHSEDEKVFEELFNTKIFKDNPIKNKKTGSDKKVDEFIKMFYDKIDRIGDLYKSLLMELYIEDN